MVNVNNWTSLYHLWLLRDLIYSWCISADQSRPVSSANIQIIYRYVWCMVADSGTGTYLYVNVPCKPSHPVTCLHKTNAWYCLCFVACVHLWWFLHEHIAVNVLRENCNSKCPYFLLMFLLGSYDLCVRLSVCIIWLQVIYFRWWWCECDGSVTRI